MENNRSNARLFSLLAWAQILMVVSIVVFSVAALLLLALSVAVAKETETWPAIFRAAASLWPLISLPVVGIVVSALWRRRLRRRLAQIDQQSDSRNPA
jgi:H+/Cl- antiporter ClcA